MTNLLVVQTFTSVTGVPRDAVQNAFAFTTGSPVVPADITLITTAIQHFYDAIPAGSTKSISEYMSPEVARGAVLHALKFYDVTAHLDGSPHGFPTNTVLWALGHVPADGNCLPQQDAAVLSIRGLSGPVPSPVAIAAPSTEAAIDQGAPATHPTFSRPLERMTGRLYLGPFSQIGVENPASIAKIKLDLRQTIINAAKALLIELGSAVVWAIWSRAARAFVPVLDGWVDDRWDSQRRREPRAVARTIFP